MPVSLPYNYPGKHFTTAMHHNAFRDQVTTNIGKTTFRQSNGVQMYMHTVQWRILFRILLRTL